MYAVKPSSDPNVTRYSQPAHDAAEMWLIDAWRPSPSASPLATSATLPPSICSPVDIVADSRRAPRLLYTEPNAHAIDAATSTNAPTTSTGPPVPTCSGPTSTTRPANPTKTPPTTASVGRSPP